MSCLWPSELGETTEFLALTSDIYLYKSFKNAKLLPETCKSLVLPKLTWPKTGQVNSSMSNINVTEEDSVSPDALLGIERGSYLKDCDCKVSLYEDKN
jgi:hypothetical protein